MTSRVSGLAGPLVFAALLGAAAVARPDVLYVLALAGFGGAHVAWELAWVRRAWRDALPASGWAFLGLALAAQAVARAGGVLHLLGPDAAARADLATLACAIAAVWTRWPATRDLRGRLALALAGGLAAATWWLSSRPGLLVPALAILAMAHNLTPVALVPRGARLGGLPARAVLAGLFAAPLALGAALAFAGHRPVVGFLPLPPEWRWADIAASGRAGALLPALVWAQCLHYLAVIVLVPRALGPSLGRAPARGWIVAACGAALAFAFLARFADTRGWYGVASGLHAWLEWPLVMLALVGRGPVVAPASRPAGVPGQEAVPVL